MRSEEKKLLGLFGRLAPEQRGRLVAFAESLAAGAPGEERLFIPRPAGESVADAIRRLVRSYPMLERRKLMGETSRLMAQHALEGRDAAAIIDELESLFERRYEQLKAEGGRRKAKG